MNKMRDTYGVIFIKLSDSTWTPKVKTFDKFIGVETSVNFNPTFEPINTRKFENKDEFIGWIVQNATKAWEANEAEKQFDKTCTDVAHDIINNKDVENHEVVMIKMSDEEIVQKVKEIKQMNVSDSLKPYLILKEIGGVDLIEIPDVIIEDWLSEIKKVTSGSLDCGMIRRR